MSIDSEIQETVKPFPILIPHKDAIEFVKSEYEHVSKYTSVIYDTRDRFFANYMTVAIALFGFLGFMLSKESPLQTVAVSNADFITLAIFTLTVLIVFGLGTLFLLLGNWLARDYYRQRRRYLQQLLLSTSSEDELRLGIQEYLGFSRDNTKWKFRVTSIYAIYISSISVANSLGVFLALNIAGIKLQRLWFILLFIVFFLTQHFMAYMYIKLYTSKEYPEG